MTALARVAATAAILLYLPIAEQGRAQTQPQPTAQAPTQPPATKPRRPDRRDRDLNFRERIPVLGLPASKGASIVASCSSRGAIFVDLYYEKKEVPDLYAISKSGDVTRIQRTLPHDDEAVASGRTVSTEFLNFFVAEHSLVTLLKFNTYEDSGNGAVLHDTRYYLSTSDTDGGSPKLIPLDLRFRPIRIARFGSGDFLVLGWDKANLQPLLALLKEDGTPRRFLDFDPAKKLTPAEREVMAVRDLEHSAFVPNGKDVLLTYPGQAKPVHVLTELGDERTINVEYPGNTELQAALPTDELQPLVLRLRTKPVPAPASNPVTKELPPKPPPPTDLLVQFVSAGSGAGGYIGNLPSPGVRPMDVICNGPSYRVTALFWDTIPNASPAPPAAGQTEPQEEPKRLVLSTSPR